ncbi:MAG: hypothetical protein J3Q66DRAFT_386164 [Benniella sp.]|nr:MAG: hypothetical protein J3Q66DRAFT_386164 [Benniella sp.]
MSATCTAPTSNPNTHASSGEESHDGGQRLGPLKCTFGACTKEYHTRARYEDHVRTHQEEIEAGSEGGIETTAEQADTERTTEGKLRQQYRGSSFYDVESFSEHLDGHEGVQVALEDHDSATDEDEKTISTFRDKLMSTVHNNDLIDLLFKWTVPTICTHESGSKSVALLSQSDAKRLLTDPVPSLRPTKRRTLESNSPSRELGDALTGCPWGGLVEMDSYEPLEPSMFLSNFRQKKEELARTFVGALLHFDSTVIMLLKVEVYGRELSEDVHAFNLAIPKADLRTIAIVRHDNTKKLVIGTMTYNCPCDIRDRVIKLHHFCRSGLESPRVRQLADVGKEGQGHDSSLILPGSIKIRLQVNIFQVRECLLQFLLLESLPRHRPGLKELPHQGPDNDRFERNSKSF